MSLLPDIVARRGERGSRLGDVIRRFSSTSDGELVATAHAMRRMLQSVGADVHDLAEHIEPANGNGFDEATAKQIYAAGYAQGVQDTENNHFGVADFRNTDGKPEWDQVALYLQRNKHRLDPKHHEFIDDMASRTVWGREPTEKQHRYLHSLFFKLGGKIT